jgi:hypothetical protein
MYSVHSEPIRRAIVTKGQVIKVLLEIKSKIVICDNNDDHANDILCNTCTVGWSDDFKKGRYQKAWGLNSYSVFIWSLGITNQTKNLNFPHFVWKQTKSLKTSNKLPFNSAG